MSTADLEATLRQFLNDRRSGTAVAADTVPTALAAFGIGLLVGAGVALLFAPASGEELREDLSEQLGDLKSRITGSEEHPPASRARSAGTA